MGKTNLVRGFWAVLRPSETMELQELKDEAYAEAVSILKKNPFKAKEALKQIITTMDVRKIVYDLYVWQRVDAVKDGINEAVTNPKLKILT